MGVLCHKRLRYRLLVVTISLLCLILLSNWVHQNMNSPKHSLKGNKKLSDDRDYPTQSEKDRADYNEWQMEYEARVQRVRDVCNQNTISDRTERNAATNRHMGNITFCKREKCTIIVDEQKLFFCFIPKIATSYTKAFLLNVSNIPVSDVLKRDNNAFHFMANDVLRRVSPAYYPPMQLNRFYKIMFVRHPFDRLVSAFRNKAEPSRSEMKPYFSKIWDSIMKKLRPKGSILDRITFKEFVWHLTHTPSINYDAHWGLFWRRCDPCFVDYNFIGKLENAQRDFPYAFRQAGLEFNPEWWNNYLTTNRSVTLKYFSSIPEDTIRKLYDIYRSDFELFGYSADEFFSKPVTVG